ncbi:hypothetical protein [Salinimicrobium sp. GXAS 041]|uniref:hypothetical protein n=1 Tax=Salinimicrobium sp. GXAS 041 TaxID=3400806 RepID=UPI003C7241E5
MKNSFYICGHLKGVQNFRRFFGKEAEIIPKEPGQVMLPRDKTPKWRGSNALLKIILAI